VSAGLVGKNDPLVKLLGNGEVSCALTVALDKVSGSAREKIVAAGGAVEE
jgi:large subunit ribosomal protein L15